MADLTDFTDGVLNFGLHMVEAVCAGCGKVYSDDISVTTPLPASKYPNPTGARYGVCLSCTRVVTNDSIRYTITDKGKREIKE